MCDVGLVRDEAASTEDSLACTDACAEGYEHVSTEEECLADAGCYLLPQTTNHFLAWCTGECPQGQTLEIPEDDSLPFCGDP